MDKLHLKHLCKEVRDDRSKRICENKQYKQKRIFEEIKIIRASVRHRHDGRYISNYEALAYVERVIYKYLKGQKNENTKNNK